MPGVTLLALIVAAAGAFSITVANQPEAHAETDSRSVSLFPVADTYASPRAPHKVNGALTHLNAGNPSAGRQVIYMRFAVPAEDASLVRSAQLELTRTNHHLSGRVSVHRVSSGSWTEGDLNAANAPALGPVLDAVDVDRSTHVVAFDVSAAVRGETSVNLGITLSGNARFAQFHSSEAVVDQPVLRVAFSSTADNPDTGPVPAQPNPAELPGGSAEPVTPEPSSATRTPHESSATVGPDDDSEAKSRSSAAEASHTRSATSLPRATETATDSHGGNDATSQGQCAVSAKLVPSCGLWWGVAPMAHTDIPLREALPMEEAMAGRRMDIVHTYHRNGQLFPTATERAVALAPGQNRLLLLNWKPATDMTWAAVAAGHADARIDRLAEHINSTFPYPFFLAIWHEPENDVIPTPGSGMTASDYAAMYRHVVLRLRADGVTNAVTVMNYMGFHKWALQSWFKQLWPGDDVVDWIALDPYGSGAASGWSARDLETLVNRPSGSFPGYYTWATTNHPGKPIMLAEWGVKYVASNPEGQATFFNNVAQTIDEFPAIRALVYFDMPHLSTPHAKTYPGVTSVGERAYRRLANSSAITAPPFSY